MKRFIITELLAVAALTATACGWDETHNYYLFSTFCNNHTLSRLSLQTEQNWAVYTDGAVSWFNADEIEQVARQKGDDLMASYVRHLQQYVDLAGDIRNDAWDYPTQQQLQQRTKQLEQLRSYAQSKLGTRLRSQHALLFMRCNMVLGRHEQNVEFWELRASKYIETVYKEMMRNIYAGALLKTGRTDEACAIFAEQGDAASLYTHFFLGRSQQAIEQEYRRNPDSPALPFLVEDFANNAQEAIDAEREWNWPGKLFVRDIKRQEAMQMERFALQVVQEGQTHNPALWQGLAAWLEFLFGDHQQALSLSQQAAEMDGEPRCRDNARVLRLYITADATRADATLDGFLAQELTWLEDKTREERDAEDGYENHYTRVFDRLVNQVLVGKYDEAGRPDVATAFLAVYDEQPKVYAMLANNGNEPQEDSWNADYSGLYFERIDTMPVARLAAYRDYTAALSSPTARLSPLEQWLTRRMRHDDEFMHELIGTKYLRLGEWQQAIDELQHVSVAFINRQNIAPFMAQRNYTTEVWMKRQRLKWEQQMRGAATATTNQKLDYAREMLHLESGYPLLQGETQRQRAYELAVRHYQASVLGDAWYLTSYGKSAYDTISNEPLNRYKRTLELLATAQQSADFALKEKAVFATAYVTSGDWADREYDYKSNGWMVTPLPQSDKYRAMAALADLERSGAGATATYVSRCDNYRQFLKARK